MSEQDTQVDGANLPALSEEDRDRASFQELQTAVSRTLERYDTQMKELSADGKEPKRQWSDVWNASLSHTNTVKMLQFNLAQIETLLQHVFDAYWEREQRAEKREDALLDVWLRKADEESMQKFEDYRSARRKERTQDLKVIQQIGKTLVDLHKEYRQGEMAQNMMYPLSQVQMFMGMVIATLQQNIHNAANLKKISDQLETGFDTMLLGGMQ